MKKNIIMRIAATTASIACSALIFTNAHAQATPKLTDPEIASVAVVANKVDIGYAEVAKKKSKNADVLKFAETMAADHKAVIDQAVALVTKLHVTPADNAVSKKLLADAEKTKKMLNSKSGKAFDKAYIDNEVAYHKAVISVVENVLIAQAQNAELKALLEKVMPTLRAHLAHAEMVQSNFNNGHTMGKM
jgi:putative membrane protein